MTVLAWLIPAALALGTLGLVGFLWALKTGQYDDLDGAAWRAIDDEADLSPVVRPAATEKKSFKGNKWREDIDD